MKPRKLPSGAWNCRIMLNGHTYSFTDSDRREVMRQASVFAAEYRENVANPPLGKCLEDFITERSETLSPATIRGYSGILRTIRTRSPALANKRIVTLTDKDVQTIINPLRTPKTQRNYVHLIQTATGKTYNVRYRQVKARSIAVPTELEVLGLLEIFKGTEVEIPIMLGAYGGLRRGEISPLTMQDMDGDYIHISKDMVLSDDHQWIVKTPKTVTSNRSVLLPHFVAEKIRQRGYITKLTPNEISNRLRKKQLSLGVNPPYSFHALRHYSASYLHAQGIPDAYIMARGGWSSPSVMQSVYRHALSDKAREMEQIAADAFQNPFQNDLSNLE